MIEISQRCAINDALNAIRHKVAKERHAAYNLYNSKHGQSL